VTTLAARLSRRFSTPDVADTLLRDFGHRWLSMFLPKSAFQPA
jgi:hypothetical protein